MSKLDKSSRCRGQCFFEAWVVGHVHFWFRVFNFFFSLHPIAALVDGPRPSVRPCPTDHEQCARDQILCRSPWPSLSQAWLYPIARWWVMSTFTLGSLTFSHLSGWLWLWTLAKLRSSDRIMPQYLYCELRCDDCDLFNIFGVFGRTECLRPYHVESTSSRPITEVKQRWVVLVLGWVTAWEYAMS